MARIAALLWIALALAVAPTAWAEPLDAPPFEVANGLPPLFCLDPTGDLPGGIPAGFVCGPSGLLDLPIDEYLPSSARTRAGYVHPGVANQLLAAARCALPTAEFARLSDLVILDQQPNFLNGGVLFSRGVLNGQARAFLAERERAERRGDTAVVIAMDDRLANLRSVAQQPITDPNNPAIGQGDPNSRVAWADTLNAEFDLLLQARIDRDRAADVLAPGFESTAAADTVCEMSVGMAGDLTSLGLSAAEPQFLGPNGQRGDADDLPVIQCGASGVNAAGQAWSSVPEGGVGGRCIYSGATPDRASLSGYNPANDVDLEPIYYVATFVDSGGLRVLAQGAELTGLAAQNGLTAEEQCLMLIPPGPFRSVFGGLNANEECILISSQQRVRTNGTGRTGTAAALSRIRDPAFRPATAILEPTVLTDLRRRGLGWALPARPGNAAGLLYPNHGVAASRRVDPITGAPVRATGDAFCALRVDPGSGLALGPDGTSGTSDDFIPSIGNCLLWENPTGPGPQLPRAPGAVAAGHPANQTLFHTLCTLAFDEDAGDCGLDAFNTPEAILLTLTLSGGPGISGLTLEGFQHVRLTPATSDPLDRARYTGVGYAASGSPIDIFVGNIFGPLAGFAPSAALSQEQQALLGCGPAFASGCEDRQGPAGGVDFLNADSTVLLQESTILKALRAGALVGLRQDDGVPSFEAGISGGAVMDPHEARSLELDAWEVAEQRLGAPVDLQIEPFPWPLDDAALAQGIIRYRDPAGVSPDPRGENCTQAFGSPDPGCTGLEIISANLERLMISKEILGLARAFDPPETAAEIWAILNGDPNDDITGDPVAGPDGIRFANFDMNQNGMIEDGNLAVDQKAIVARQNNLVVNSLADCIAAAGSNRPTCYRSLEGPISGGSTLAPTSGILVGALPLAARYRVRLEGTGQTFSSTGPYSMVPIQALTPVELQDLEALKVIKVDAVRIGSFPGPVVPCSGAPVEICDSNGDGQVDLTIRADNVFGAGNDQSLLPQDIDGDGTRDLNEDEDATFDFVDDGTRGPVAHQNILCGSGLPGDILQDAMQWELDDYETAALQSLFPNGLPERSPVYCSSLLWLLGLTGEVAPGQRAFLWHGAAPEEDPDTDGYSDALDSCPLVTNPEQEDPDGDGVGDACDICPGVFNPPVPEDEIADWMTLVNGQRDDDGDGIGNRCDFKYGTAGSMVGPADVAEMRASILERADGATCGTSGDLPCAWFDHDELGLFIGPSDIAALRARITTVNGPSCGNACTPPFDGDVGSATCEGPGC